ncbi:MAG: aminotransferase class V-fold PLP-dependent enzyme [Proteobacteria bacterium]|nr:aminotransferase class V-fold PLP-dependent enzyme [Pseudomonadota bacterium]
MTAKASTDGMIYLDYQATTPTDPRVLEAMLPHFGPRFGNPHSASHAFGRAAEAAVEEARARLAALIGAEPREIVFTSGATEANNLAIKGRARFARAHEGKDHLVACATEHKCVLESLRRLEGEGFRVTLLPVGAGGLVDLGRLAAALTPETALVSIMAVNNEIGVIQPIAEIGALCRAHGVTFHSDAAQAVGKIPLDVEAMGLDLLSVSAHKVYGPMGVGALYVRRRPRARVEPLFDGGGQERGLRSGTVPLPLAVGLGEAARIAGAEMAGEGGRLRALRDRLLATLRRRLGAVRLNGDAEARVPGNLNLAFEGVAATGLVAALAGRVALSTGSACSSAEVEPSYVLRALGLSPEGAAASVRIGLGRFTTEAEVEAAAGAIAEAVERLRGSGERRKTA